ncbi:MAG TPA: HD domain-containing protein [Gemmatimonadaceae bacterium]|nr:HD domain-containing protein [Gemmatimonadaceae bacterium]
MRMEIIRDPLWNNVRVDELTISLIDTRAFQRLRYIRQLGWAYLVYPGSTHTRFEHAIGTHHLARRALALLEEREALRGLAVDECAIIRAAALLHDIGHYPFSHALEEMGAPHHEEVAKPLITDGAVAGVLEQALGAGAPGRIYMLIRGESDSPLQGLISGPLDLDKIEYLKRDALMCGVPYGEIDVDRLLNSLVIVEDPETGQPVTGIVEKGLSALESLLFAKYQMYRNVYWHHAVRSATAMYKRLVEDALGAGSLDVPTLSHHTDEGLLHRLETAAEAPPPLLHALRERRLYKRAFECPAAELDEGCGEWIAEDRALTTEAENALALEVGLQPGQLLLDFPAKTQMLGLDLPVLRRDGRVERLTEAGWEGAINLPKLSEQLYHSARWMRVFVARRTSISRSKLLELMRLPAAAVRRRLDEGRALLT